MSKQKAHNCSLYYFQYKLQRKLKQIVEYPCTLLEAPMGYGKTTAIREYLKTTDSKVLWQKIYDNSITGFWNSFCLLLGEIDDTCVDGLIRTGFPSDSASREEVLRGIQKIIFPPDTVLVLDDYHLFDIPEMDQFIEFLVWNELDNLHLVLTARYTRMDNLEELVLKGYLNYITKDMLEFEPEEITSYYKLCGINLKEDESNKIYSYTEGWISALYLMMLNYKSEGSFEITLNITRLIEKAVYLPFSQGMKEFLITVCLFDSFTRNQALHMWKKDNTDELLSELIHKNTFVNYDEKRKEYQIHTIFLEFLRDILESKSTKYKTGLYQRAAKWFMNHGNYIIAMSYYSMLKDFDGLLTALEADRGHSIFYEHKDVFIDFYRECPRNISRNHPIALLVYAMCLFSFYEMELFAEVCEEFGKAILEENSLDSETIQTLMGEFELLLSFTEYNDIDKMLVHVKNSRELLKHPAKFIDTRASWTFGSPSVLYLFHREAGELANEVNSIREALPIYNQITNGHGKGGEYVMDAERHFFCGDFDNAEILTHKAIIKAKSANQADIIICACFLQIRIALAKGDYSKVITILKELNEDIKSNQWSNLIHTVQLVEAYILAGLQQEKGIPLWIEEGNFNSTHLYFPTISFLNIIYGRVLLIKRDYSKLLGLAGHFIESGTVFPNLLGLIYSYIYIAAANEKLYRREASLEALELALTLALPDEIYMPFAENSDFILPLLKELCLRKGNHRQIDLIVKMSLSYQISVQRIKQEHFTQIKPKLTGREAEIARMVSKGMSNNEIGNSLFISQNTVKTLLKRIFEKLNINSRTLLKLYIESEEIM